MGSPLPTLTCGSWTLTHLTDSLKKSLSTDTAGTEFNLFAYAVTMSGWNEVRREAKAWMARKSRRKAVAYIGTDHALTDPDALRQMESDGVSVRLMVEYTGTYHPKVFWLQSSRLHSLWVGSNNLTRDGLLQNIEFATLIQSPTENPAFRKWFDEVHRGSEPLSAAHLRSYETERRAFARKRAATGAFTWSGRREPPPAATPTPSPRASAIASHSHLGGAGDLVIEVMPRETGLDGKQIQLPKDAATTFFGLGNAIGAQQNITLTPAGSTAQRSLTMTLFPNNTTRLSIHDLDYRDRPCVIVFRRSGRGFQFEIVSRSIFPNRYRDLLRRCIHQTRSGARRWAIL